MKKVLLGLSGGVDSAISAYLLKKEGYEVTGAFMRNWDAAANGDYNGNPTINEHQCPQEKDYDDAKEVAERLQIPLIRIDFIKEYWDDVFSYFLSEYKEGRTPNPDILCNKNIKFGPFLDYAKKNGFDNIAMGHYAKKVTFEGLNYLAKPKDLNKDQTYFLQALSEVQISSCLFPMENITKPEAREIAHELGLEDIATKHGSTGICFIGERHFREFLTNYFPASKGEILDIRTGKKIGEHMGVLYYTIGQRKGLGIGGISGGDGSAYFIAKKDAKKNIIYAANGPEEEYLFSDECLLDEVNLVGPLPDSFPVRAKFRYRMPDVKCLAAKESGSLRIKCLTPVKAITPGQFAALYSDDGRLLGGGRIIETFVKGKRNDI